MRTPIIDIKPGWRNNIIMTWDHLREHYHILPNDQCATHIHISLTPHYNLDHLKRIASAIIYFEPAFEALVPEARRGNEWARSIWLESPNLAWKGKSRSESIEAIQQAPNEISLISLLQTFNDAKYSWNFWSLTTSKHTIEYRQPPASAKADEVLSWAELALTFIQVSMIHGSAASLHSFPANLKGLRWYLDLVKQPAINEPHWLQWLWNGKPLTGAVEPTYDPLWQDEMTAKLKAQAAADMRLIRQHPRFYH